MKHNGFTLTASYGHYANKQPRIQLYDVDDGCPYATASVELEQPLLDGEIAIKDYSENEGILDMLVEHGVVDKPHRFANSGFVTIPICMLKKGV